MASRSMPQPDRGVIEAGTAAELYALDRDACPYWCVQCAECYCRKHWYMDARTVNIAASVLVWRERDE